jgi:primosomal protein N' (replication factor Y)
VEEASSRLASALREALPQDAELLGPAPMFRVRGRFRRRLLLKCEELAPTVGAVRTTVEEMAADRAALRDVALGVDVEPQ